MPHEEDKSLYPLEAALHVSSWPNRKPIYTWQDGFSGEDIPVIKLRKESFWDFPGGAVVKNPPANAADTGSSPGPGRSHMLQCN